MNYLCITEYFHLSILQPERIDPSASRQGYDVRSDVWSLGITLVRLKGFIKLSCCDKDKSTVLDNHGSLSVCCQYELATGRFPYPKWNSVFDQLTQVVKGEPPQLSNSEERQFSPKFTNFVNLW